MHKNSARRLDRVNLSITAALRAMRTKGAALHFQNTKAGPLWILSDGTRVTPEVARAITADRNVIAVDHALFKDSNAQTWRYAWTEGSR